MSPSTPETIHQPNLSSTTTPDALRTEAVGASESVHLVVDQGTSSFSDETITPALNLHNESPSPPIEQSLSSSSSSTNEASYDSDLLEMLENDEESMPEEEDEGLSDPGEPLFSGRRQRRRRWTEDEDKDRSLFELVVPLLLSHPLPLYPLLPLLSYNFLPAGVVFFIPIICVLTALSSCAHIVIVYLAWYLKVTSIEQVFDRVMGQYGRYGQHAGRAAVITATLGLVIGWLETFHPLVSPMTRVLPGVLSSRIVWTIIPALTLLPSLIPSRLSRTLRRVPLIIALLIPVVTFLVIGRTVEIKKASETTLAERRINLGTDGSAGAGLAVLTIFLSPHLNTLPIHSTLSKSKRASFALPCLISSGILLALTLPFALVPYYLLPTPTETPTATPTTSSGVFDHLPIDDGWVNLARVLQCAVGLSTCSMWLLRCRDSILEGLELERGRRFRIARWIGLALWAVVLLLSSIGGWIVEKLQTLGVIATLAVGWLLPSVFFIITFHVRSPLSIVFPSRNPPPPPSRHGRSESLSDPSVDVLLARKERQLQKRRLGRRLWQDLIVYVGILPVGCVTIAWSLGSLFGLW